MSTAIKVKTNRRNALASTGPTSDEGKAIVGGNAVRHGLLSWKPVVAEFESEQEWDGHHQQTLLDLRPVGHLETLLAERVALLSWRLGRVARFELEVISTGVEDAEGAWNRAHARGHSPLPKLAEKISELRRNNGLLEKLPKAPDDQRLNSDVAVSVIEAAAKAAGVRIYDDEDGKADVQFPSIPDDAWLSDVSWTAALLRGALGAIAQAVGWTLDSLLSGLIGDWKSELGDKTQQHGAHKADFERFRRRMLLPDEPTMERVRRYETTFERAMLRCLHELQRLQAARHGQSVPAPIAVDVNLSGDSE